VRLIILSHLQEGDFAGARQAAKYLRSTAPDVCDDLLAQVNREERDYNAEVTRLQRIVATTPDPEEAARAQLLTGHAHQKAGRLQTAADSYGKVVDLYPVDACAGRAVAGVVTSLVTAGRTEEGLTRCEEIMGRYPQDASLARSGASAVLRVLSSAGSGDSGEAFFCRLIAAHPSTEAAANAQLALAATYGREKGEEFFEQGLIATVKGYPASAAADEAREQLCDIYYRAARACEAKDDADGMILSCQRAAEFDTDDARLAGTLLRIAYGLMNQGRGQDALAYLRRVEADARPAFRRYKDEAEWLEAAVYYQMGNQAEALTLLRRIASSPDHRQQRDAQQFLERLGEAQ
jgi:tetratricopeptide (TPR) repeat protein